MSSMRLLDGSSSSSDGEDEGTSSTGFKVNQNYANHYNSFREKELYQKLKAKYGEEIANKKLSLSGKDDSESESSSEEEDDDARQDTPQMDKEFFILMAALKSKDPALNDPNKRWFSGQPSTSSGTKGKDKKEKAVTLKDMERNVMLGKAGQYEDLEDKELERKAAGKSYVQEMEELKKEMRGAVDNEEDSDDGLLTAKARSADEKKQEEADYRLWLAGKKEKLDNPDDEKKMKALKDYWNSDDLDEGEKFLRDYFLKKRWLEKDDDDDNSDQEEYNAKVHDSDEGLSEDEATLKKTAEFEHKYNFRFEEPDSEFIKRYPRTIKDSMRLEKNSRKQKREAARTRKEQEKEKRREELKQLKALKRKEIMQKISKLKKIAGNDDLEFNEDDLEKDFDPNEYDSRMASVFNQYDDLAVENEDEKPVFSDLESDLEDELETDNWDAWAGQKSGEVEGDKDEDEEEDEDEEAMGEHESEETKKLERKRQGEKELIEASRKIQKKRKSKFAEVIERKKRLFQPENETFEKYLDEYYKLDYEDMIGDVKCRFRYRNVPKNDFGLSTGEILSAPDRELNAWCSLKKTCQFRTDEEEQDDIRVFDRKRNNVHLKQRVMPSLFSENLEAELQAERDRKSVRGKKRKFVDDDANLPQTEEKSDETDTKTLSKSAKKRLKRKAKKLQIKEQEVNVTKDTEEAPEMKGEQTKKEKKKKKAKLANELEVSAKNATVEKSPKGKKSTKLKKDQKKKKFDINEDNKITDSRLERFGIKPNQYKRKEKKKRYRAQE